MTVPANLLRRVEDLEATLGRLNDTVHALSGRLASVTQQRWIYLAKTIKVGGSYPTSGNTFGLQFIDREFTPTEGTQAATDRARSATSQAVGRTLTGEYLSAGRIVLAIPAPLPPGTTGKGRWHILPLSGEWRRGITAGTNDKGSHGNVTRYTDGTNTASGETDDVYNDFINVGTGKIVIYVRVGPRYQLVAVECPPT